MNRKALIGLVLAVIVALTGVAVSTTDVWAKKTQKEDDSGISTPHLGF